MASLRQQEQARGSPSLSRGRLALVGKRDGSPRRPCFLGRSLAGSAEIAGNADPTQHGVNRVAVASRVRSV